MRVLDRVFVLTNDARKVEEAIAVIISLQKAAALGAPHSLAVGEHAEASAMDLLGHLSWPATSEWRSACCNDSTAARASYDELRVLDGSLRGVVQLPLAGAVENLVVCVVRHCATRREWRERARSEQMTQPSLSTHLRSREAWQNAASTRWRIMNVGY